MSKEPGIGEIIEVERFFKANEEDPLATIPHKIQAVILGFVENADEHRPVLFYFSPDKTLCFIEASRKEYFIGNMPSDLTVTIAFPASSLKHVILMIPEIAKWKINPDITMKIRKFGDYHLTSKEKEEFLKKNQKK